MVGIPNDMLATLGGSMKAAEKWVAKNVTQHINSNNVNIRPAFNTWLSEMNLSWRHNGSYLGITFPALRNIQDALAKAEHNNQVKVTVPLNADVYSVRIYYSACLNYMESLRTVNWKHSILYLAFIYAVLYFVHTNLLLDDRRIHHKKWPHLPLRFRHDGTFKILQVADMHFGAGLITRCRDVLPSQFPYCTDLNTTRFLKTMIQLENPDFVAFTDQLRTGADALIPLGGVWMGECGIFMGMESTFPRLVSPGILFPVMRAAVSGKLELCFYEVEQERVKLSGYGQVKVTLALIGDNIFGPSTSDAAESLLKAFGPVTESGVPWVAVLGNHDQESTMTRGELMYFISLMDYSLAQTNPPSEDIDGFGNYDLSVYGAPGSRLANSSVLNLLFLDSGDRETVQGVRTYGWIKESQLLWLRRVSQGHQGENQEVTHVAKTRSADPSPALAFFHIPIPEVWQLYYQKIVGQFRDGVSCSSVNSGVLNTLVSIKDVKAVFIGHDHNNDFCGNLEGIWFCYGGGFGYHGYGRAGLHRRARVILAELRKGDKEWMGVERITTWKRLDDENLSKIDEQVLWESSWPTR
ncbi:putative inactive purple acid phosphatase 28 [Hibiscus syriacus]|uniref:Inactive purple acid phosphatase 28 n=1 Tax=Hibiscus syriacus TaxID=106335 RepID=A0A6A3CAJ5_HIBSY|nr:putative inactive purple acid phosphatase 28 [Hibiscus syriacus]